MRINYPEDPEELRIWEEVGDVRCGADLEYVVGLNSCWWLLTAGSHSVAQLPSFCCAL